MRLAVTAAGAADGLYREVPGMVDVFAYDIVEAFGQPGCPLCRALEEFEVSAMVTFLREGHRPYEVRLRFCAGGGFCGRHAWLLHRLAAGEPSTVVTAHVYRGLVDRDLELIGQSEADLARRRKGRVRKRLRRDATCLACAWAEAALRRKAAFLVDALGTDTMRAGYLASDGVCYGHLAAAVEEALDERPEVATFLLEDWRKRLERLAHDLAEYDRKRDHRYRHEPKGAEQESRIEAIRRYVGQDPTESRASNTLLSRYQPEQYELQRVVLLTYYCFRCYGRNEPRTSCRPRDNTCKSAVFVAKAGQIRIHCHI